MISLSLLSIYILFIPNPYYVTVFPFSLNKCIENHPSQLLAILFSFQVFANCLKIGLDNITSHTQ